MMTSVRTLCAGLMPAILGLFLFSSLTNADPLPILDEDARKTWQAVGRVNGQGYRRLQGCSGTLIAPDLVVTAAHCVVHKDGIATERHFVAGWYRGRFAAHRVSHEVDVHPLYSLVTGRKRLAYDIALLHLDDPIPVGLVAPVPLLSGRSAPRDAALLLGYQNTVPHALGGKSNCERLPLASDDWLLYGCEVINGTSGGAVIVETPEGPALAGVIVARSGPEGHALTVPVDTWLRDAWRAAMARARGRP